MVELQINWGENLDETIVMSKFVSTKNGFVLPLEDVIDFSQDHVIIHHEETDQNVSNTTIINNFTSAPETDQKELTPEERIKKLEEEKAELQVMLEQDKKYKEFRKMSDEVILIRKAMIDAGFSRQEAMDMMTAALGAGVKRNPFSF